MKSMIVSAAVMMSFGTALAVELVCYDTGVPSPIGKGDIEYAIKNRSAELGIPGGTKFSFRWKTCTTPENSPKDVAVITTPSITREGSVKLANGVIECSTSGPPDSTC
ncbi:hypothetical protein CFIO01_09308 [Colletotrichum fioriniae PJ7]|uniref:Uncharacterized protein n=1 Tax=Colletotrichum fioriniae PJ7 TaxID=1445577 RepID=A0A010S0R1_9PEZI|nr:hypothetical protein CFIO01_09308 [Colletotrichum fioriniae PJ7]